VYIYDVIERDVRCIAHDRNALYHVVSVRRSWYSSHWVPGIETRENFRSRLGDAVSLWIVADFWVVLKVSDRSLGFVGGFRLLFVLE